MAKILWMSKGIRALRSVFIFAAAFLILDKKLKLKPVLQLAVSHFHVISFHCRDQYSVFGVHSPGNSVSYFLDIIFVNVGSLLWLQSLYVCVGACVLVYSCF